MFARDAAIRRVNGEGILLLGGGRALLMQLAHPAVAAGVAEHSEYRGDRRGRLLRTRRPMYAIAFGTRAQAARAASDVNAVHRRVAGTGYRATDPALLVWVHATLIDTALLTYRRFVGPLPPSEAERYLADMTRVGSLLGIPDGAMPGDVAAFSRYVDEMVATLVVGESARSIAAELLSTSTALAPAVVVARELTAGLLPPRLRAAYGLSWDPARAAVLETGARLSRIAWPRLPRSLRAPPAVVMPARSH